MTVKYVQDAHALPPEARIRLSEAAEFVCRIWRRQDASIWELPEQRHYTQGKLACWLALDPRDHPGRPRRGAPQPRVEGAAHAR